MKETDAFAHHQLPHPCSGVTGQPTPRTPRGIYAVVNTASEIRQQKKN